MRQHLLREAQRVSAMPATDQAAWLEQLRGTLASRPNCEEIVQSISSYMTAHQKKVGATAQCSSVEDQLEAHVLERLEIAVKEGANAFENRDAYCKFVIQVAVLGHSLPHVKERLALPDAQEFLNRAYRELIR